MAEVRSMRPVSHRTMQMHPQSGNWEDIPISFHGRGVKGLIAVDRYPHGLWSG